MTEQNRKSPPLQTEITWVKGVGPLKANALNKEQIFTVRDLLWYIPRRYLDRTTISAIRDLPYESENEITVIVKINNFGMLSTGTSSRFVVVASDATGIINFVWFNRVNFWSKSFTVGETVAFSGKVTTFRGVPQIQHPEFDKIGSEAGKNFFKTGTIVSQYPSTEGLKKVYLDSRGFRKIIKTVVDGYLKHVIDPLPKYLIEKLKVLDLQTALKFVHFPQDFEQKELAIKRLKFDELFFFQLLLATKRQKTHTSEIGINFEEVGEFAAKFVNEILPFELTDSQKNVIRTIRKDMKSSQPMNRLLQGDVGSGKTVVAVFSCLMAIANGFQAAIMAPTEILAEQHFENIKGWFESLGIKTEILVGKQRKKRREKLLSELESGEIKLLVGTHALIEDNVVFKKLGFVVIDEQHRFGVIQRAKLREKGFGHFTPDVLVMTATPIPRTLAMTVYGDLDVSVIRELPKGRKPIKTKVYFVKDRSFVFQFVRSEIKKGRQAYIIYPLVEESEKLDLKAATESYYFLQNEVFAEFKLGLLHGKMKNSEKDEVMQKFKAKELDILVSTTVVEVGVDVPNSSVMLVEHAERFGLSQLHQLRGRVGRSDYQSYCLLVSEYARSAEARQRLKIMEQTNDGFRIAEEDLQIRGSGDFFGTKQSGMPEFKIAKITEDGEILELARKTAFSIIEQDPQLQNPEHKLLQQEFKKSLKKKIDLSQIG